MKNSLFFTHRNAGFVFPGLLILTGLLFSLFYASVSLYESNRILTLNEEEQIKLETLFQMAHETFTQQIASDPDLLPQPPIQYNYPYGTVTITYNEYESNSLNVQYQITTSETSSKKIISRRVQKNIK